MNLQHTNFSINWMALKLNVTRSGYYAWLHRQGNPGPRAQEEERLIKAIEPIFIEHKERYGSFRIHQELRGQGFSVSRKRVARIMRKKGLQAKFRKRFKTSKPTGSGQLREIYWIDSFAQSVLILPGLETSHTLIRQMDGVTLLYGWTCIQDVSLDGHCETVWMPLWSQKRWIVRSVPDQLI